MLLTEFNQEMYERTVRQEGIEEGEKRGEKKGASRLNTLYLSLINEGRMDDLEHAIRDNNFRAQLFQSHNL